MKLRKITSLTALLSFAILMLTSIILYIVPPGRVAYWAEWHLWGLSKTEWDNIHITIGILFLITACLHIYYNWKPMVSYLKNQARKIRIFTREFNAALVLTLFVTLFTYFELPPVFWLIDANTAIKDAASRKYGEPPYGHAELSSLKSFCAKMQLDVETSLNQLKAAGMIVDDAGQSIAEIAARNQQTPQQIYLAMQPSVIADIGADDSGRAVLPDNPPAGFGNQALSKICAHYQLNPDHMLQALSRENIIAEPDMTIRMIAGKNTVSPMDVYLIIKAAANDR